MASITWDNVGASTVSLRVQLEQYLDFSIDYINSLLVNPINFDVVASIYDIDENTIAQARSDYHPLDAAGSTVAPVGMVQASSGVEVAGKDAFVEFNQSMIPSLFLDTTPFTGTDVPQFQFDLVSTIVHELLHALAFMTFSDEGFPQTTPMDRLLFNAPDGKTYFTGKEAIAAFGGPVPLADGSISHLGEPFTLGADLMYPSAFFGYRSYVSDLDLAMMRDMGIPTVRGNTFNATAGADTFNGNNARDVFIVATADAGSASDTFNGQLGHDVVRYSGTRAEHSVVLTGDTVRVTHGGSTDTLNSIERIEFSDGVLLVDFDSANADAAYRLYGGAFDRTPDEGGLRFWTFGWLNQGESLLDAAATFIGSDEFKAKYGSWTSDADFVSQLYRNVLGREGESEGLTYWTDALASGAVDRAAVLVNFTQLQEYVGLSSADLQNGYWVA